MAAKNDEKPKISPEMKKQIVETAVYGSRLATLLWQKALSDSTPETRRLLLAWVKLNSAVDEFAPVDAEPYAPPTKRDLWDRVESAEFLLTGYTNRVIE